GDLLGRAWRHASALALRVGQSARAHHAAGAGGRGDRRGVLAARGADYREQAHSFDAVAEYHSMSFIMLGAGDPVRVATGVVSANYFDTLGVRPILGRAFFPGEDAHGAPPVLLLGHAFWRKHFGGRRDVIGQSVEMNDR